MKTDIFSRVREYLEDLDVDSLVEIHNHVEDETAGESRVYPMWEAADVLRDFEPMQVASMVYYGDFCPARDYFWFNGYGNLESSDFLPDVVFTSDLARYIVDEGDDCGNDEIREILDEDDDDDETGGE